MALAVQRPRHDLLARAGLALHEHRRIGRGDAAKLATELLDGRTAADEGVRLILLES